MSQQDSREVAELAEVDVAELTALERLRELSVRSWAVRSARGIEVLDYDHGMQVLEHPKLLKGPSFQYRLDQLGIQGEARRYMDMGVTNTEGEQRRQMRASLAALFRPAQIAKLRERIRTIVHEVIDQIEEPPQFELMRLCWEVPARTYCELVSIPYDRSATVIRIADSVLGTLLNVDVSRREEAEEAILESVAIVREHLDIRRGDLGDDFTSVMIRQQEDGLVTEEQLVAQSFALLQASVDNTAHQLGNTFGMLLSHPERWRALVDDRQLRGAVIEEAIRLHPRFGTIFRLAAEDVTLDGVTIRAGEWAFVSVRSGQRDPAFFDCPDDYRLDRGVSRPLMFGGGPYNCLGQNLARMEIEETLLAVLERYPGVSLTGAWKQQHANAVSETTSLLVDLGAAVERSATPAVATPAGAHAGAPGSRQSAIDCEIVALARKAHEVVTVELRARDGGLLPRWRPGAHIELVLPGGIVRPYSLCGDPGDERTYTIAVQREEAGSGGSAFVHDRMTLADRVAVRGPRNNFELGAAPRYLFVAGGIGITAILPMVRAAQARGDEWSLLYLGRSRERLAFLADVAELPAGRVRVVASREEGRLSLEQHLAAVPRETVVYACGPEPLLTGLAAVWPEDRLRVERFRPDAAALAAPRMQFSVQLTRAQARLEVPPEKSILDVVEDAGIAWPYSCREGTCGSCEARIVAGVADHRDAILTPAERSRNEHLMICVSRATTAELWLEI